MKKNTISLKEKAIKYYEHWFRIAGVKWYEPKSDRDFITIWDIVNMRKIRLATFDVKKDKLIFISKKAISELSKAMGWK